MKQLKSIRLPFSLVLAPILIGLGLAFLIEQELLPNHIIAASYAVDLAWVIFNLGWLVALFGGLSWATYHFYQRQLATIRQVEKSGYIHQQKEFLRRLDHEFKNPLTIVRLSITNLAEAIPSDNSHQASLRRIGQQTERLQRLIKDLRQLSELQEHIIEKQPVNIAELIQEIVEIFSEIEITRTIQLNLQTVPWSLSLIHGDRDLLTLALQNILANAIKFTAENGIIEVRGADDGQQLTIEIADNGIGIPEEALPLIYDELYRASNAHHIGGNGLGLSIVKTIIAMHGGQVDIRSKTEQGTVVTLQLPI